MIIDEIAELLKRKQQIDASLLATNRMVSYDRWSVDAMELLLRIALEQEKREKKP
jgi:hypothetical protein